MTNAVLDFASRDVRDGVDKMFYQRWSPRCYQSRPVAQRDLNVVFDAARWSPSCYNEQPWRFITSTEQSHETFVSLLVDGNQKWAKQAPVIGFVIAEKLFARNGKVNEHAAFDSGAAWMAVNLQARLLGLYAHGMAGIHYDRVYETLSVDKNTQQVICAFTLGYLDEAGDEQITSRKSLSEIWRSF